jgi:hypothetical protein
MSGIANLVNIFGPKAWLGIDKAVTGWMDFTQ